MHHIFVFYMYHISCVFVVYDVSLSYSSLPYEGVVQITTDGGTKNVCWKSLKDKGKDIACRHLGHDAANFLISFNASPEAKDATFSGSISCNGEEKYLSQCSITASADGSCSELSFIRCVGKIENEYMVK